MDKSNYSAGIAQVSRRIWKAYSDVPYSQAANPKNFEYNLEVGARYLRHNYDVYGSWKIALEAYNEGETVTNQVLAGKRDFSPITKRYVAGFEDK